MTDKDSLPVIVRFNLKIDLEWLSGVKTFKTTQSANLPECILHQHLQLFFFPDQSEFQHHLNVTMLEIFF